MSVFGYGPQGWKVPPKGGSTGYGGSFSAQQMIASIAQQPHGTFTTLVYKLGSTYYAEDWVGNVVKTSTTAQTTLQHAFDRAGRIFIKNATYPTTSQLTAPSDTKIVCESWSALIQGAGSHVILTNTNASDSNIEVEGGTWDGNNGTSQNGGIYFENVDNVYVHGVASINSSAENIKVRNGNYTRIIGNYTNKSALVNSTEARANINSATGSGDTVIVGNTCINAYGEAIGVFKATGGQVTVTDNTCTITTAADSPIRRGHILVEAADGVDESFKMAIGNNTVISNYYGINLLSAKNFTCTGNVLTAFAGTASLNGININGAARDGTVTGNVITGYGQDGINCEDTAQRISIGLNNIHNCGQTTDATYMGIRFKPRGGEMRDIVCNDNTVTAAGSNRIQHGIYIDLNATNLTLCDFSHNKLSGQRSTAIGYSLSTTPEMASCQISRNLGDWTLGNIANPFNTTDNEIGFHAHGSSSTYGANPVSGQPYTVRVKDILVTSHSGTNVVIQVAGPVANEIIPSGGAAVATLAGYYVPRGYTIEWTFDMGGEPTVKVHAL